VVKLWFLVFFLVGSASAELLVWDGCDKEVIGDFLVYRNPFFIGQPANWGLQGPPCNLTINISSPLDGSNHGRNNIPLTSNVSSNVSVDCWYRIDGNAWNLYNCTGLTVTVPNNLNVTLTVLAIQGSCSATDTVSFTVYGRPGGFWVDPKTVYSFLVLSSLGFLLILDNTRIKEQI
jgi:hypothetical protein